MSKSLGLFLGGTGKYAAELLKGWSTAYGWTFDDYMVLDTDPQELLPGPFALGPRLTKPERDFHELVDSRKVAWAKGDLAQSIRGWEERHEASVMIQVGRQLNRITSAAGAGMWALRAMGLPGYEEFSKSATGQRFLADLRRMLGEARTNVSNEPGDDHQITLYVVSSTAGGTGAGFLVPLVLKVREFADPLSIGVVPLLAMGSTFHATWGQDPARKGKRAWQRGETGSFALMRELQFLSEKAETSVRPARRTIPTALPLHYFSADVSTDDDDTWRSYKFANHVYWFGRRRDDDTMEAREAFQELGRIYSALSDSSIAEELQKDDAIQAGRLSLILSSASVEYRKLELSRRIGAELTIEMIGRSPEVSVKGDIGAGLLSATNRATPPSYFGDWPVPGPVATLLRTYESRFFARESTTQSVSLPSSRFEALVEALSGKRADMAATQTINPDDRKGFYADDDDWQDLVNEMKKRFDSSRAKLLPAAKESINQTIKNEVNETKMWLRTQVVQEPLNDRVAGVAGVQANLRQIQVELRRVLDFVRKDYASLLIPTFDKDRGEDWKVPAVETARGEKELAESKLNPQLGDGAEEEESEGSWTWLWLLVAALAGVGAGVIAAQFMPTLYYSIGIGIGTFAVGAFFVLRRQGKPLTIDELRRRAVRRYQLAYLAYFVAETADYAWKGIHDRLIRALVEQEGSDDSGSELGMLLAQLEKFDRVLTAVKHRGEAEVSLLEAKPRCVVAEVGADQSVADVDRPTILGEMRSKVHLEMGQPTNDPRLRIECSHDDDVRPFELDELEIASTSEDDEQKRLFFEFADELGAIADLATTRAEVLEESFTGVVDDDKKLAGLLSTLGTLAMARGPAAHLLPALHAPKRSLLVAGSDEIAARVGQVIQNGLVRDPTARQRIQEGLYGNNLPLVSRRVGQGIALFDLWEASNLESFGDYKTARNYYYNRGSPNLDMSAEPREFCAGNFEFHILPELSTAAYLEFRANIYKPLAVEIVRRLRGSDPRLPGATFLDLFYTAKVHDWIKVHPTGARESDVFLEVPGVHRVQLLHRTRPTESSGEKDVFGEARETIDQLDAFCDFLTYESGYIKPEMVTQFVGAGVDVSAPTWATLDPGTLRDVKLALSRHFDSCETTEKADQWLATCLSRAEADSQLMGGDIGTQWLGVCGVIFGESRARKIGPGANRRQAAEPSRDGSGTPSREGDEESTIPPELGR